SYQSPVIFQRGFTPNGSTQFTATSAIPGFNFNTTNPLPTSNIAASPDSVGYQSLGNFGTGRASATATVGGLVFTASSNSISVLIRALKTQGRIDPLNRTNVMTVDQQAARINVGQEVPIVTSTTITGTAGAVTQNIDRRQIGVILTVTPRINDD